MQSKPDLHSLTQAAYDEVQETTGRSRRPTSGKGQPLWWKPAAWTLLGVLLVYGLWQLGNLSSRKGASAEADLESVLTQARDVVEAARRADRDLPDALPSASLAAIVRYERYVNDHHEQAYRLSVSSHGITLWLDSDGNRDVRRTRD